MPSNNDDPRAAEALAAPATADVEMTSEELDEVITAEDIDPKLELVQRPYDDRGPEFDAIEVAPAADEDPLALGDEDDEAEPAIDETEAELAGAESGSEEVDSEQASLDESVTDTGQAQLAVDSCWSSYVQPVYITPKGFKGADRSKKLVDVLQLTQGKWKKAGATFKIADTIKIKSKHTANWFRKNKNGYSSDERWFENAYNELIDRVKVDFWNVSYVVFVEVKTNDTAVGKAKIDMHYAAFDFDDNTGLLENPKGEWGAGVLSHELSHTFGMPDKDLRQCDAYKAAPAVCDYYYWPELRFANQEFREMHCDDQDYEFFQENCNAKFPKRKRLCPDFKPRTN